MYHKPDNYDSVSEKKRDIGTLNMFLFYKIFTSDLLVKYLQMICWWFKKYGFWNKRRIGNVKNLINAAAFNRVNINLMTSSQLACKLNWLERCTGIAEVRVRIPASLIFFRLSFRNCISCVNNCEDLLYIYFFTPQFKYMNFIYS